MEYGCCRREVFARPNFAMVARVNLLLVGVGLGIGFADPPKLWPSLFSGPLHASLLICLLSATNNRALTLLLLAKVFIMSSFHPFQITALCNAPSFAPEGLLLAACGSQIISVKLADGSIVSQWSEQKTSGSVSAAC